MRQVLTDECPIELVRDVVENDASPEQPWKSATELGWAGIAVPERCGGLGLGAEELGLVAEEHGRVLAPGRFLATAGWFVPLVREAGSESLIVADGTSCRHQIHDGAEREALHVARVLEMALAP